MKIYFVTKNLNLSQDQLLRDLNDKYNGNLIVEEYQPSIHIVKTTLEDHEREAILYLANIITESGAGVIITNELEFNAKFNYSRIKFREGTIDTIHKESDVLMQLTYRIFIKTELNAKTMFKDFVLKNEIFVADYIARHKQIPKFGLEYLFIKHETYGYSIETLIPILSVKFDEEMTLILNSLVRTDDAVVMLASNAMTMQESAIIGKQILSTRTEYYKRIRGIS